MLWRAGLEHRYAAKIVRCRINGLALIQSRQHFRGSVPHATIHHINERSVVGLNGVAGIQIGCPIRAQNLPISPALQNATLQTWSRNAPAPNRDHPPMAVLRFAEIERRGNLYFNLKRES